MIRVARFAATLCTLALAAAHAPAAEHKYPLRPIRLIVTFPPGGGTDILARIIAPHVSESLGQPVVVDNRGGAGGTIGMELGARAAPDGYTLVMVSSSYAATAVAHKLAFDPVKDIQPIILFGTTGLVLAVHPSVPAQSVGELIAYAQANPGKLNYASVGPGSVTHLSLELFKLETRTNLTHVPYKGGGPALAATVAGEAQLTSISMVPTIPHVKAGRLRALAVTSEKRTPLLPGVPTVAETVPGYTVIHWYGMWGPKGLPRNLVALWNREVAKVLQTEEMKKRLAAEGLELAGGPPEEFLERIRLDVEKWRRVVREAKITVTG